MDPLTVHRLGLKARVVRGHFLQARSCMVPRNPGGSSGKDQSTKRYLIRAHRAGMPSLQVIFFPSSISLPA
jgi:hypothetical protein